MCAVCVDHPIIVVVAMQAAEVQRVYDSVVSAMRKRNLRRIRLPALRSAPQSPMQPGDGGGGGGGGGTKKKNKRKPPPPYTVGGLMLVFFASRLGEVVDKTELVEFLRKMKCGTVDPQPRHLGMQVGLNFLVQGCVHPKAKRALKRGEYCLLDLRNAHPSHATMHRAKAELSWGPLKSLYGGRCACCGSVEGERHLKNAHLLTTLERGHCDPRRPLTDDNCIPMCKLCNMVYKDHAVLSRRGFVVQWLKEGGAVDEEPTAKATKSAAKVDVDMGEDEEEESVLDSGSQSSSLHSSSSSAEEGAEEDDDERSGQCGSRTSSWGAHLARACAAGLGFLTRLMTAPPPQTPPPTRRRRPIAFFDID